MGPPGPPPPPPQALPPVAAEAGLREVMTRLAGGAPVPVAEGGRIVGAVTAEGVIARLLDPRA
jgi:glycine betaine/proline transport system ATP-binding protein